MYTNIIVSVSKIFSGHIGSTIFNSDLRVCFSYPIPILPTFFYFFLQIHNVISNKNQFHWKAGG